MAQFGDVLRGLGSVLNPQVMQGMQQEDQQRIAQQGQMQGLLMSNLLAQNTPQAKIQLEQLKNDQEFRSGASQLDPNDPQYPLKMAQLAAQKGKPEIAAQLYKAQEDRAARIQTAHDALETRKLQIQGLHEQAMQRLSDSADRTAEIARHNQQMEGIQAGSRQLQEQMRLMGLDIRNQSLGLRREMFDNTQQQQVQNQTTKFANTLQQNKVPQLASSLNSANDLLKKYENTDIPGFGIVEGSAKLPNALRSTEGNNVRSAVQGVTNDLLNMYSGLAVTLPESERRTLEQMNSGDFSEKDFRNAWPRIVSRYNQVVGNIKAGANPKALELYQSQPGAMKLEPITPTFSKSGRAASDAPKGVDPKVWEVMTPEERKLFK